MRHAGPVWAMLGHVGGSATVLAVGVLLVAAGALATGLVVAAGGAFWLVRALRRL